MNNYRTPQEAIEQELNPLQKTALGALIQDRRMTVGRVVAIAGLDAMHIETLAKVLGGDLLFDPRLTRERAVALGTCTQNVISRAGTKILTAPMRHHRNNAAVPPWIEAADLR